MIEVGDQVCCTNSTIYDGAGVVVAKVYGSVLGTELLEVCYEVRPVPALYHKDGEPIILLIMESHLTLSGASYGRTAN